MKKFIFNKNELLTKFKEIIDYSEKQECIGFEVKVKPIQDTRSLRSNRFFHGAVLKGFKRARPEFSEDQIKQELKFDFLRVPIKQGDKPVFKHIMTLAGRRFVIESEMTFEQIERALGNGEKLIANETNVANFEVGKTSELTNKQMAHFIDDCIKLLTSPDINGYLDDYDGLEYIEIAKENF